MGQDLQGSSDKKKKVTSRSADADKGGVSVFSYIDYREYLKAFYQSRKAQNSAFSFAGFAMKAKINTPNYLKRVIDGDRSLNAESIPKFCFGLGLSSKESIYFEALVNFNQTKDEGVRKHYWGIMRSASQDVPGSVLEVLGEQFEVYSHWYILPVRELVLLKNFNESPAHIVKMMKNKITKKEAEFAIQTLLNLEMLKRDGNGKICVAHSIVRYSQEVVNLTIREFHRQMLQRTGEALSEDEFGTWNVRALSLAVKKEKFQEIYQKISDFIFQLNREYSPEETANENKKESDLVVQINCQMVQLTETEAMVRYDKKEDRLSE